MTEIAKLLDGMTRHVVTVQVTYDVHDFAQYTRAALAEVVMESVPSTLPDVDGDEAAVIRHIAVLPVDERVGALESALEKAVCNYRPLRPHARPSWFEEAEAALGGARQEPCQRCKQTGVVQGVNTPGQFACHVCGGSGWVAAAGEGSSS